MKAPALALLGLVSIATPVFAMGMDSTPPAAKPASNAKQDYEDGKKAVDMADYGKAIDLMKKVVAVEPNNADAYNYLGFSYRKNGDVKASAISYETALKIDPNHKGALEYQGELFLKLGKIDDALKNHAKLQGVCPAGCPELSELERAIADYNATNPKGSS